jgi:hypothetical protein
MNYIIEDNFNFFEELKNSEEENSSSENICLLSNQLLDKNAITLECNHKFNFLPLYNEIVQQKNYNNLETTRLKSYQIKCPYCRLVSNKLLPHIKINDKTKFIFGVNSPSNLCMINNTCSYIFKSGKNKGICCNKSALYFGNNYYCNQHKKYTNNPDIPKNNSLNKCKAILKTGKNKGLQCTYSCIKNSDYCKRHNK